MKERKPNQRVSERTCPAPQQAGASGGFDASRKFGEAVRILADGSYTIRDRRRVDVYEGTFDVRNLTEEGGLRLSTDVLAGPRTRVQGGVFASVYRDQLAEDQRGSDEHDGYECD